MYKIIVRFFLFFYYVLGLWLSFSRVFVSVVKGKIDLVFIILDVWIKLWGEGTISIVLLLIVWWIWCIMVGDFKFYMIF